MMGIVSPLLFSNHDNGQRHLNQLKGSNMLDKIVTVEWFSLAVGLIFIYTGLASFGIFDERINTLSSIKKVYERMNSVSNIRKVSGYVLLNIGIILWLRLLY